jgi:hypothetical protein
VFTALLSLIAQQQGLLLQDEPVSNYADFHPVNPFSDNSEITFTHLGKLL